MAEPTCSSQLLTSGIRWRLWFWILSSLFMPDFEVVCNCLSPDSKCLVGDPLILGDAILTMDARVQEAWVHEAKIQNNPNRTGRLDFGWEGYLHRWANPTKWQWIQHTSHHDFFGWRPTRQKSRPIALFVEVRSNPRSRPKCLPKMLVIRTQSGKDCLVYGCANTSLNKLPFALATTSIQTHSHLQSCYPANKEAQDLFCLWLCKRKLEQIPFCTCHNPNPKTRSSSQLLPTNKECASTPPEAELHKLCFAQCTYSARTVHGTVHATVHGHKTL